MSSMLVPDILMTLYGIVLLIFHRKMARRYAVYHQTWPETNVKTLEWGRLLAGAGLTGTGIASFAFPDIRPWSFLFVILGLSLIFLSDWSAWNQSERYWRIVWLLVGLAVTAAGVLCLLQMIN
jgi:hypothetical protein